MEAKKNPPRSPFCKGRHHPPGAAGTRGTQDPPRSPAPWLSRRERLVLELLAVGGEMAGLELVAASRKLGRGTVYVALRRLADKGLVRSRRTGRGREMPLRLFRTTGREATTW